MSTEPMYSFTIRGVAKAMELLKPLENLVFDEGNERWCLVIGDERINLVHLDGWSPGYFRHEDDSLVFVPSYTEDLE